MVSSPTLTSSLTSSSGHLPLFFDQPFPYCPCADDNNNSGYYEQEQIILNQQNRFLQTDDQTDQPEEIIIWEVVYTSIVLFLMFAALISDKIGADMVMMGALTLYMVSGIITVDEGIAGFANEGLLTVLSLFIVAAGIGHTGALDWYMSKLLGTPKSLSSAQLRLMIPISIVSAFMNNTPVVAIMIPIVQSWSKKIQKSARQLLIPLSFASILGGTCTLIGTSTNLVVLGLLETRYGKENVTMGLFDLGEYGVPITFVGMTYIVLASGCLLGSGGEGEETPGWESGDEILLGARLTKWSNAAGRTVARSGLRDTGGLFLVSVHRVATGNVHRAVGQDFVLNVGDVLYFTGLIEGFGDFCEEHGLEVLTSELEDEMSMASSYDISTNKEPDEEGERDDLVVPVGNDDAEGGGGERVRRREGADYREEEKKEVMIIEDRDGVVDGSIAVTNYQEKMRVFNQMLDAVKGFSPSPSTNPLPLSTKTNKKGQRKKVMFSTSTKQPVPDEHAKIVVVNDKLPGDIYDNNDNSLILIGIDAPDRPGLLLDISKTLLNLDLQLRHTEASVCGDTRSVSIWRCEMLRHQPNENDDDEGITPYRQSLTGDDTTAYVYKALNDLLHNTSSSGDVEATKTKGLKVIRAIVCEGSRLVGRTAPELNFRERYKASIVAVQKKQKKEGQQDMTSSEAATSNNIEGMLSHHVFETGDVLVLQARDDSSLLIKPPEDFYKNVSSGTMKRGLGSFGSLINLVKRKRADSNADESDETGEGKEVELVEREAGVMDDDGGSHAASDNASDGVVNTAPLRSNDYDSGADDFFVGDFETGAIVRDSIDLRQNDAREETDNANSNDAPQSEEPPVDEPTEKDKEIWRDLRVIFLASSSGQSESREFLTAMQVAPRSQLTNKSAIESGLNKLPGIFLVSIERPLSPPTTDGTDHENTHTSFRASSESTIPIPIPPPKNLDIESTTPLQPHDILWFSTPAQTITDLRKIPGLILFVPSSQLAKIHTTIHDRRLVQAVISQKGELVNRTLKDVRFRTKYGAAVIAIHREGKRIHQHPGQVKLQAGDVLLLEAGPHFVKDHAESGNAFALLSEVKDSAPPRLQLLVPALIITVAMLAVYTFGILDSLLVASLLANMCMLMLRILSQQEARDAVHWDVYVTIASAFGIGSALTNSGVAGGIANFLVGVSEVLGMGDAGLYGAVYLATFLISNVVTNNAAAALVFPIAMNAAEQTGADTLLMSYCLMLAASASFMSPFGYTTNLMIYGPGGYKYMDFVKFGTPMQLVLWIFTVALLSITQPMWYLSWIATAMVLIVVAGIKITLENRAKSGVGGT